MINRKKVDKIIISGGTGIIGTQLYNKLKEKGYYVAILGRTKNRKDDRPNYIWDIDKNTIENDALKDADYIIHLAGANIGDKRWTKKRKKQIIDSRTKSGKLIFDEIQKQNIKLKAFISASAIGYYGAITSDTIYSETSHPHIDFLSETCQKWEQIADKFEELNIRTVKIRTGIVLTKQGGALAKIKTIIKKGFGSSLGSGTQYMPWIHIDDLCNIYIKAIENKSMKGAYNAVAPNHVTNKYFTETLARVLKKHIWMPNIPEFILKLFLGKMHVILLNGSRISSAKIIKTNYKFKFTNLENALVDLIKKS